MTEDPVHASPAEQVPAGEVDGLDPHGHPPDDPDHPLWRDRDDDADREYNR